MKLKKDEEQDELDAAKALLLLCKSSPKHFQSDQNPKINIPSSSLFLRPWGFKSKRSNCNCNRPSPSSPLDFKPISSDLPSTSGSDGFHTCSDFAKVERFPLVEAAVTSSKPIKRQGRKKKVSELQEQEKSLREEKTMLIKLVGSKRKDVEALIAENKRLKSEMAIFQRTHAATEAANSVAFLLPDLNEPLLMETTSSHR